uniref:Putative secreted protein n=1 Tax=Rhipicephalus microplus TaxID=6941 RepID=A0A6G5A2B4_RHIMP
MRSTTFVLLLVIWAPIHEVKSFGFGVLLARIMARLPQLLRPALRLATHVGHYGSEIADAALQIQRKSDEPELPDVYRHRHVEPTRAS